MSPQRKLFASLCLASSLSVAGVPALAEEGTNGDSEQNPTVLAEEAAQKLMFALELMLQAIPQYALPEVMENGDIIIRRLNPDGVPSDEDAEAEPDETEI